MLRVKQLRENLRLTKVQLANSAKISRQYLAEIEKNEVNPSFEICCALAQALGVKVSDLIEEN